MKLNKRTLASYSSRKLACKKYFSEFAYFVVVIRFIMSFTAEAICAFATGCGFAVFHDVFGFVALTAVLCAMCD